MTEDIKKQLEEIVPAFAEAKKQMEDYKKTSDKYNKDIKDLMRDLPEEDRNSEIGDYKVTFSVATIEKMNEDAALEIIKQWWTVNGSMENPFIKRVETVDFDALENAIYKGDVPKEVLAKLNECRTQTTQERLTVKLKKKGE